MEYVINVHLPFKHCLKGYVFADRGVFRTMSNILEWKVKLLERNRVRLI